MNEDAIFSVERACLNILLTNPVMLRQYVSTIKETWMTTPQRKRILKEIKMAHELDKTSGALGDAVYEHNIREDIKDDETAKSYLLEWKAIKSSNTEDSMTTIVDIFNNNDTKRNISDLLMQVQNLTKENKLQSALSLLQQNVLSLSQDTSGNIKGYDFYDFSSRKEVIKDKKENPEKYLGVPSGIGKFDAITGGFFKAELYLVSAVTGVGKSTFKKALAFNMIRAGKNVLHVTNEENGLQVLNKYDAVFTDLNYRAFKRATIDENEIEQWEQTMKWYADPMNGKGRLFVLEIPQQTDSTAIERYFFELKLKGINIDAIIVDYLDHMGSIYPAWNENDAAAKASGDLKQLSINCDVPVITSTQAATQVEAMQKKGKTAGKMDVYGSKQKTHKANMLMHVKLVGYDTTQLKDNGGIYDTEDQCDRFWHVYIAKSRDTECFGFGAKHFVQSGRIVEYDIDNNLAKQEFKENEQIQEYYANLFEDAETEENLENSKNEEVKSIE